MELLWLAHMVILTKYFKPLIIRNILQSIKYSDSQNFTLFCVKGIKADKRIKKLLDNSLMLLQL